MDLTLSQKLGIGFIVALFAIAGVYLYYGMRPPPDMNVSSWIEPRPVGVNPLKKIGPTNPIDPKASTRVRIFAFVDGKLYVTEYSPESGYKYSFDFKPDTRHNVNLFYQDPWTKLEAITDPYKKTISFAAYADAEGSRLGGGGVLRRAKLTQPQLDAELIARKRMEADVKNVDDNCKIGNYKPDLYNKVIAAYNAYISTGGDPAKDTAKAQAAATFLKLVSKYLATMDDEKQVAIEKYIAALDTMLTADQKKLIADSVRLAVRPRAIAQPVLAG